MADVEAEPRDAVNVDADALAGTTAHRATADIAGQLASRVVNLALGVVVTAVLARALGQHRFGQWSTIFAVTVIAGSFADLGLNQIAVRQAASDRGRESVWLGALLGVKTVIAIPVALVAAGVLLLLANSAAMRIASVVVAAGALTAGASAGRAVFQLRVRNAFTANIELANGIAWAAAVVAIAALDGGLVAFAVAFLVVSVATAAFQLGAALRLVPLRIRGTRVHWPELVRAGVPVAIATLLMTAYGRIDQVLVFKIAGDAAAGLYGGAYRVLDRAILIPGTIMATLFPIMSAAFPADLPHLRRVTQTGIDLGLAVGMPSLAFAIVAGDRLMGSLFGEEFAESGTALAILMGAFTLMCVGYAAGHLVIVLRAQRRFVRYALAGLVLNVAGNLILLPKYGYLAAAWLTVATEVLVIGLTTRLVLAEIGHRLEMGRIARIALAAAAMGLAVWGLRAAGAPFGVLFAAAPVLYGGALWALRAVRADELALMTGRG